MDEQSKMEQQRWVLTEKGKQKLAEDAVEHYRQHLMFSGESDEVKSIPKWKASTLALILLTDYLRMATHWLSDGHATAGQSQSPYWMVTSDTEPIAQHRMN